MTPENLKFNEVIRDTDSPEKKGGEGGYGVEIVKSPGNTELVNDLQQLESALSHDTPVSAEQILEVEKSLDSMKVVVGGDEMTIGEMRQIPDLEKNAKIWEEIKAGDFSHHENLTYLTSQIAHQLSGLERTLYLHGLTTISDTAAEHLSRLQGRLYLDGLASVSDTAAKHLSHHRSDLFLHGLTSISDTAAEHLSHHQDYLSLSGAVRQKVSSFKKPQS